MDISTIKWPDALFVTGIGTDVGKSYATGWLARELRENGVDCITQKMIQTGNVGMSEDILVHRKITGTGLLPEDLDHTTAPVIFTYPASPHLAARIDGATIDFDKIDAATEKLEEKHSTVLIEGAGGLMVPLEEEYLTADYIRDRRLPALVVIGGQLGSINLVLLTLNAIKDYGIDLFGVIYNPFFDKDTTICNETRSYLKEWISKRFQSAIWLDMPEEL
jgi:dethiobiotin synthase